MGIWRQFLLMSWVTLLLPWAGCQYVKEMESTFRQSQQEALYATAQAISQMLSAQKTPLFAGQEQLKNSDKNANSYVMPLKQPLDVDGYADDWGDDVAEFQRVFPSSDTQSKEQLTFLAGATEDDLYLMFEVVDDQVVYRDVQLNNLEQGDRIVLEFYDEDQRLNRYTLSAIAPGEFRASYMLYPEEELEPWDEPTAPQIIEDWELRGVWQATHQGFNVELKIPRARVGEQLSFTYFDSDMQGGYGRAAAGTLDDEKFNIDYLLIYPAQNIHELLTIYQKAGQRLRLVDQQGWVRADVGDLYKKKALYEGGDLPDNFGGMLLYRLYSALLEPTYQRESPLPVQGGRIDSSLLAFKKPPQAHEFWYRPNNQEYLGVVFPIFNRGQYVGSLIAERQNDTALELTNHALGRLFYLNFLAIMVVVLALLGFTAFLSLRIRRLSRRAQQAISRDGRITATFKVDATRDEIGDLSRHFADLLGRLKDYNEYLQGLSGKLSHELRTPLAVVKSSLENLEQCQVPESGQVYMQRATQGVTRLASLLSAMSEATRVEQVLQQSEMELVNLSDLVLNMGYAYQDLRPEFKWKIKVASGCVSHVVPELIAQMLDKLVDNACDFTAKDQQIHIQLDYQFNTAILRVCNKGPLLPQAMADNLFDSLVSVRKKTENTTPHLGFGLFIVRLISDFHQGEVKAYNQADASGVCFEVKLPIR